MTKRDQRKLQRLLKVTDAAQKAAQARLLETTKDERACQAAIDQLDEDRVEIMSSLQISDKTSAAQVVVDAGWLRWAEKQRGSLNMSLARARAQAMRGREEAKRTFGRHQAAAELVKRAISKQRR